MTLLELVTVLVMLQTLPLALSGRLAASATRPRLAG
jgi:hypothetical protein